MGILTPQSFSLFTILNLLGILAPALRAGYRDKVRVSLKFKIANPASEENSGLVYFIHIIT